MVRRSFRLTVRLAAWLVASMAVVAAVAVWRLAAGPLPLDVLTPYLERALSIEGGEVATTVGSTELRIARGDGLSLVALGVSARSPTGEVLFDLPEVEVGVSMGALVRHQVLAPARLRVRSPSVVLVRRADGSIGLSGTSPATGAQGQKLLDLEVLAGAVLAEPDPASPLSFVDLVGVEGAKVTLEDEATATRIEASRGALSVVRENGALAARAALTIERAGRALDLTALARFDPEHTEVDAALEVEDARPVDLRLIQDLLPNAAVVGLEGIPLETIDLRLNGRIRAQTDLAGGLLGVTFRVESDGGRVVWPDQLERPLELERLDLTGAFDPATASLMINDLQVLANRAAIGAAGVVRFLPDGPEIQAEATLRDVPVAGLGALWPVRAADEARAWVTGNILAGRAPEGTVRIDIRPGDLGKRPLRKEALTGSFSYEDLTVRYFKPLPPVAGIDGEATFDAQTMTFAVRGGRIGALRAGTAGITITGIGIKGRDTTQVEVETSIEGPLEDALALIDLPPFGFASEFGIAPAAAQGSTRTLLRVGLPLHREVSKDEVRIGAEATLGEVAIERLFDLADLTDGAFQLRVDRQAMTLQGQASLAGVPLEVDWEEVFGEREYDRRFEVQGMVDPAALSAFGIDALPVEFDGAARTRISVVGAEGSLTIDADLDLATARLAFAPLDWRKPVGEPAELQARLEMADGSLRVERFDIESAGLSASGDGRFRLDPFRLQEVEIRRFEQDEQRLSGRLRLTDDDVLEVVVDARRLDLRPLLAADEDQPTAPGRAFRLEISAREVLLEEGGVLRDLQGTLARDRGGWRSADLEAVVANDRKVELRLRPEEGVRRLVLTSDDAGELFETFNRARQIEGGRLRLEADIEAQRPALVAAGRLTIEDFTLHDAPILARLLTVASPTGIGNLLQGEGISVDRLDMPFRLDGDRLTLEDGRLTGSQLGLTVEGTIDLEAEQLDLDGTIVPIYGLNRAIGAIPLIGDFLTGSEGIGAFAATYGVSGPIDDPSVSVNPLSALAPGFLRELFTGLREGTLEPPELPADRN